MHGRDQNVRLKNNMFNVSQVYSMFYFGIYGTEAASNKFLFIVTEKYIPT